MKLAEAKIRFEAGDFSGFFLARAPMQQGWFLFFNVRSVMHDVALNTQRGEQKLYKTVEAAVSDAEAIGFKVSTLKNV